MCTLRTLDIRIFALRRLVSRTNPPFSPLSFQVCLCTVECVLFSRVFKKASELTSLPFTYPTVVHRFYTQTEQGRELLRRAGLTAEQLNIDHIYPRSNTSPGLGLSHVCNYYLLSKAENKYFSDRTDVWIHKTNQIGSVCFFFFG